MPDSEAAPIHHWLPLCLTEFRLGIVTNPKGGGRILYKNCIGLPACRLSIT